MQLPAVPPQPWQRAPSAHYDAPLRVVGNVVQGDVRARQTRQYAIRLLAHARWKTNRPRWK
jgi:hypothetical protein